MLVQLGKELKKARAGLGVSLQAVAVPAEISAAYLHKLEQGRIETPSPHVLRRVGSELGVPYLSLMVLAGYLEKPEEGEIGNQEVSAERHPHVDKRLSDAEWRAVNAFIEVLVAQR